MTPPSRCALVSQVRRASLGTIAAAATLALLGAMGGCVVGDPGDRGGDEPLYASLPEVDCTGLDGWAQGTTYLIRAAVTDAGDLFEARVTHTAFGPDWNPKNAASLWLPVGSCAGGGGDGDGGGGGDGAGGGGDDAPPPPDQPPPAECVGNGRPGPLFDPAGVGNVGNGVGGQFITGQCLRSADCASGCCAGPCGICSGPAVGDVPPKTGCGFPDL